MTGGDATPSPGDERSTLTLPLTNPPTFEHPEKRAPSRSLAQPVLLPSKMAAEVGYKGNGVPPILALVTCSLLPPSPPHPFSTLPSVPYDHGMERSTGGGATGESHSQWLRAGSSPNGG